MDYSLTGLFGYVNQPILNPTLVDPMVTGLTSTSRAATGALAGFGDVLAEIRGCHVYIEDVNRLDRYTVSGSGAVGGLMGRSDSVKFTRSFAAIPVSGTIYGADYQQGVGGFTGYSIRSGFSGCYASGSVRSRGGRLVRNESAELQQTSTGTGGFTGSSYASQYTDCFATGSVRSEEAVPAAGTQLYGVGGFVGVLQYRNALENGTSLFRSCYALGEAYEGKHPREPFVGVIAPGHVTSGCYYLTPAVPGVPTGQSNLCAAPMSYEALSALVAANGNDARKPYYKTVWEDMNPKAQGDIAKTHPYPPRKPGECYPFSKLRTVTTGGTTYSMDYYGSWPDRPSALPGQGLVYYEFYELETDPAKNPYLDPEKIPELFPDIEFEDQEDIEDFIEDYLDDWEDAIEDGTLLPEGIDLKGARTHLIRSREDLGHKTVISDGYAILWPDATDILKVKCGNTWVTLKPVTAHGVVQRFNPVGKDNPPASTPAYAVYKLPEACMRASADSFYTELHLQVTDTKNGAPAGAPTEYYYFYNPDVARSQVNPGEDQTQAQRPSSLPEPIEIRSARQFRALSAMCRLWNTDRYHGWTSDHHYYQPIDIDADSYFWDDDSLAEKEGYLDDDTVSTDRVDAIGIRSIPFDGIYAGPDQPTELRGFLPSGYEKTEELPDPHGDEPDDVIPVHTYTKDAGIFGRIGSGTVKNLIVKPLHKSTASAGDAQVENLGVVVGYNSGTVSGVHLKLEHPKAGKASRLTLKASQSAGGLAGSSDGTVSDCSVSLNAGITLSLDALHTGGLAGRLTGGSVTRSRTVLGADGKGSSLLTAAADLAGFTGSMEKSRVSQCSVTGSGSISAPHGRAAGFAGTVGASSHIEQSLVTPVLSGQAYLNNRLENLTVSAKTEAAGFAGQVVTSTQGTFVTDIQGSHTLCRLESPLSSGFAGSSTGKLIGCSANVSLTGGHAFSGRNQGYVSSCYGWYTDGSLQAGSETQVPGAATEKGTWSGSYFGDLKARAPVCLYDVLTA